MPTFAESKRINEYLITEVCESLTNVPFQLDKYMHNYILGVKYHILLVCENRWVFKKQFLFIDI